VLDISKAESNKIELHPEPYPFDEFIGAWNIFGPLCAQNGQKFVVEPGSYAPGKGVIVDRVRFDQVVMNILSNAVKYTPAGGTITYTLAQ
jgi:signal transduction histidine kinase